MQQLLFEMPKNNNKTYRALRHDVVRLKQKTNSNIVHHPDEKINQIKKVLSGIDLSILELFSGHGNCTKVYSEYGDVLAFEKSKAVFESLKNNTKDLYLVHCNHADSFNEFHRLIFLKQKFDVVDLDPYGFPNRFFPDIYLLIDDGILFVTMPKPYVNILNGITAAHLVSYFGNSNPKFDEIIERFALWGLCHWREVTLLDYIDCKSVWRFAFSVKKVKATDYTGVKNR